MVEKDLAKSGLHAAFLFAPKQENKIYEADTARFQSRLLNAGIPTPTQASRYHVRWQRNNCDVAADKENMSTGYMCGKCFPLVSDGARICGEKSKQYNK